MNIAVGIVAHEFRRAAATRLAEEVDAEAFSVDDGTLDCAGNHLTVLTMMAKWGTQWSVVLEDDAVPVGDLRLHVKQALVFAPAPIVGLYLGTGNPSGQVQRQIYQALDKAQAWITADCLIGSVGYVIRTGLIARMLPEVNESVGSARRYGRVEWPLRISRWAQRWEVPICYTVPSLVDHADELPIGFPADQPRSVRKAWSFGTRENWDTPAVPLGHCIGWSRNDTG